MKLLKVIGFVYTALEEMTSYKNVRLITVDDYE